MTIAERVNKIDTSLKILEEYLDCYILLGFDTEGNAIKSVRIHTDAQEMALIGFLERVKIEQQAPLNVTDIGEPE